MDCFDRDGNGSVSCEEFLSFVGDKRRAGAALGDTSRVLAERCLWQCACHECGMANAFQVSVIPDAERAAAAAGRNNKRGSRWCAAGVGVQA